MDLLPVFRGWTVDVRLRQFRKVRRVPDGSPGPIEFLDFSSQEGDALFGEYIETLSADEVQAIARYIS